MTSTADQFDDDNWMRFDGDSTEPTWTEDDLDEDANELDSPEYNFGRSILP